MSCNSCPLLEICRTNMELERKIGLFAVESDYVRLQEQRQQEWTDLADEQPIYIDSDDSLVGIDKRLLQAESALIASNEIMDKVDYQLKKSAYSEWLDKDKLKSDEFGCEGPKQVRNWRAFGQKALICASRARIYRAEEFELKIDEIQD